jgi:AcrR family transcriptional regulator
MGRPNISETRKKEISQALFRCIVKQGYINTSIRGIAKEAGILPGLIHHYFSNKDEILFHMTETIYNHYLALFAEFMESHHAETPLKKMELGFDFLFLKIIRQKELSKVVYEMVALAPHNVEVDRSLKILTRRYRKFVRDFMRELLTGLGYDTGNADPIIDFITSAGEGAGLLHYIDPRGFNLMRTRQTAGMILRAAMQISV